MIFLSFPRVSPEFPCTFIGFKNDFLSFPFVSPELPCTFLGFKYDIFRYPWLSPEFPQNFTFFRYGTEKKSLKLAKLQTTLSPEFPPSEFPQNFTEAFFLFISCKSYSWKIQNIVARKTLILWINKYKLWFNLTRFLINPALFKSLKNLHGI